MPKPARTTVLGSIWYATPTRGANSCQFIFWMPCDETPPWPNTYIRPSGRLSVAPFPAPLTDSGNVISQRSPMLTVSFDVARQASWAYQKRRFWLSWALVLVLTKRPKFVTSPNRKVASPIPGDAFCPAAATPPVTPPLNVSSPARWVSLGTRRFCAYRRSTPNFKACLPIVLERLSTNWYCRSVCVSGQLH